MESDSKRIKIEESFELLNLPSASLYEKSWMHRDIVTQVVVAAKHDFVITSSQDGYVKFWRKTVQSIEFVKAYRAHLQPITSVAIAHNEDRYATCSAIEQSIKVFDVVNFDLMNMIKLSFTPNIIMFVHKPNSFAPFIAVASE